MSRGYLHIKEYENEILELKAQGKTNREICEKFGFTMKQLKDFITRHNNNTKKLKAGVTIRGQGRPRKDGSELPPSIQQLSKVTQMQYELARKESKIKSLEMQIELMRDFLSRTERK